MTADEVHVGVVGLAAGIPSVVGALSHRTAGPEIDVVGIVFDAESVSVAAGGQDHVFANLGTILVQGAHAHRVVAFRGHIELSPFVDVEALHPVLEPQGEGDHIRRQRLGDVLVERDGGAFVLLDGHGQLSAGEDLVRGDRQRGRSFLQAFDLAGGDGSDVRIRRAEGHAVRVGPEVIVGLDIHAPFKYLVGNGNGDFFPHENDTLVLQETHLVLDRFLGGRGRFVTADQQEGCRRQRGGSFREKPSCTHISCRRHFLRTCNCPLYR